jgi:hypothetical protein
MANLSSADYAASVRRNRIFLIRARSHLLCLRMEEECRRSRWLVARSRHLLRRSHREKLRGQGIAA